MNIQPELVVFSVFHGKNHAINQINHKDVKNYLIRMEIGFIELIGSYQGQVELSIALHGKHIEKALSIAKKYNQESILYSHNDRQTELIFIDDYRRVKLGKLVPIPVAEAVTLENYSYCPSLDQYYTTR